jgi:hypothetical protein
MYACLIGKGVVEVFSSQTTLITEFVAVCALLNLIGLPKEVPKGVEVEDQPVVGLYAL